MRGTPPALPLTVSARIQGILEKEYRKVTISTSLKQRIGIILDGVSGKSIYSTSKELNFGWKTVQRWRDRWESEIEDLIALESEGESGKPLRDYEILTRVKVILADKPRSGRNKRITLSQEQQIVALACDKPEDHDIEMTNWTHAMLAQVAMSKGIVDTISERHVGNILKKKN